MIGRNDLMVRGREQLTKLLKPMSFKRSAARRRGGDAAAGRQSAVGSRLWSWDHLGPIRRPYRRRGGADLLLGGGAAIAPATAALRTMVRDARGLGVQVLLAGLTPFRPGTQRGANAAFVPPFNDQVRMIAQAEGATYVDTYTTFDLRLIGVDGLHPTAAGYTRLAEIFAAQITTTFERRNNLQLLVQNLPDSGRVR